MLFAVRHAVFSLPSKGDLVVAREHEGLTEVLLEVHPIIEAEFRAQPLEQVGREAVALGAHQLERPKRREPRDKRSERIIFGRERGTPEPELSEDHPKIINTPGI